MKRARLDLLASDLRALATQIEAIRAGLGESGSLRPELVKLLPTVARAARRAWALSREVQEAAIHGEPDDVA